MKTAAALIAGLVLAAAPGVSSTSIEVGTTGDPASPVVQGATAYLEHVNARGGVNGRRIDLASLDDGGDPAVAAENARELIRQGVFALFSVGGTASALAARDVTAAAGVPQVFSASGATALGRGSAWATGFPPPYSAEGQAYARHVLATNGRAARIAVLYQADAYGRDLLAGVRKGLAAKARTLLAATAAYDPAATDVRPQVAELQASGANTLMVFTSARLARQALAYAAALGWAPQVYVSEDAATQGVEGAVSALWAKDPAMTRFARDGGVALARRIAKQYLPPGTVVDRGLVEGMAAAYSFVDALRGAGSSPTRAGLLRAVTHMREASNPFLLPGVGVRTTPAARFPVTALQLRRWHQGRWETFGGVLSLKP